MLGIEVGGGGRGGGRYDEPVFSDLFNSLEVLGAGVGLALFGFIVSPGESFRLVDVLAIGDGFNATFDEGGGGAGRFFLLFVVYELLLLAVDNAGEGGDRKVTFE